MSYGHRWSSPGGTFDDISKIHRLLKSGRNCSRWSLTKKERGSNLRWSPSTVGALPGMCPNRSSGRDLVRSRPRENSHVVGALGVLGDVEALTLGLDIGAQSDDDVDNLVEDRRTDARPHQRGADAPGLRD